MKETVIAYRIFGG